MSTASATSRCALSDEPSRSAASRPGADDAPARSPRRNGRTLTPRRRCAGRWRTTVERLAALGIGRGDRVAIVLPNGPEMATAFVSVAAGATTAPLNPAYRAEELDFYLSDLGAEGADRRPRATTGPAVEVARPARHRRAAPAHVDPTRPAGWLRASAATARPARRSRPGRRSRTTWRWCCTPRAPPRGRRSCRCSQRNLAASARHIGATLALTPDRPLPQRHAAVPHPRADRGGAVARSRPAARSSARRASTRCASSPGSSDAEPTWYTAVPTMHQAILAARRAQPRGARRGRAALHPLVLGLAAAAGDGGARGDLRRPVIESLRHDRGGPPDGLEPAAAGAAQAGLGRHRRRAGGRDHGDDDGRLLAAGDDGRGGDPRPQRHGRLRGQSRGQPQALFDHGLVPHRRPGRAWTRRAICASPGG